MKEISDTRSTFASEDARPWSDEKKIAFDKKYTAALMEFVNGRRYVAVNPSDREEWFSAWRARAISDSTFLRYDHGVRFRGVLFNSLHRFIQHRIRDEARRRANLLTVKGIVERCQAAVSVYRADREAKAENELVVHDYILKSDCQTLVNAVAKLDSVDLKIWRKLHEGDVEFRKMPHGRKAEVAAALGVSRNQVTAAIRKMLRFIACEAEKMP